jgi:hypothetical protein
MDQHPERHLVSCKYYVRTPVTANGIPVIGPVGGQMYRYEFVDTSKFHNSSMDILTMHPPQVGDLVHFENGFKVVERSWEYSRRGSDNWPADERMPIVGPHLTLIVERYDGPFVNELVDPDVDE